jgi:hypothetical protein
VVPLTLRLMLNQWFMRNGGVATLGATIACDLLLAARDSTGVTPVS